MGRWQQPTDRMINPNCNVSNLRDGIGTDMPCTEELTVDDDVRMSKMCFLVVVSQSACPHVSLWTDRSASGTHQRRSRRVFHQWSGGQLVDSFPTCSSWPSPYQQPGFPRSVAGTGDDIDDAR